MFIYKCDFIYDCFDLSDEDECGIDINNKPDNSVVTLPCLLVGLCTYQTVAVLPIKNICDGIYSNETIQTENNVCYKYTLKHINLIPLITNNMIGKNRVAKQKMSFNEDIFSASQLEKERCTGNDLKADNSRGNTSLLYKVNKKFIKLNKICTISAYIENKLLSIDRERSAYNLSWYV